MFVCDRGFGRLFKEVHTEKTTISDAKILTSLLSENYLVRPNTREGQNYFILFGAHSSRM